MKNYDIARTTYEYTHIRKTPMETPIFYAGHLPSMAYEGLRVHCYD